MWFPGPAIVTLDEIEDPHNLRLQCLVNGVTKQDSNTNQVNCFEPLAAYRCCQNLATDCDPGKKASFYAF